MVWHDHRFAVLDLETTSPDPEEARIVTAAFGYVSGGQHTDLHCLLANPGVEIPAEATAVHGVTTEHARQHGRPIDEVLDIVLGNLDRRPAGAPVVAFNAAFDLTVLDREARRHGYDPLDAHRPLHIVDPFVIDKHLHRYRPGRRTLTAMCAHYGARLEAAHAAGADAIAAGRLAWAIAKRGRVIRRVRNASELAEFEGLQAEWFQVRDDLELLHRAQVRWRREQALSLAEYFERQGQPKRVATDWPLIPVAERSVV
jgi:DNA polymerase-3 subunit epsilon